MPDRAGPQPVAWALFGLKGRIRRATYALGIALVFSIWWVCLSQALAFAEGSDGNQLWTLILGLVILVSSYCIYALTHKRLHDLGYSGLYTFAVFGASTFLGPFGFVPYALVALVPGEADDNKYGPPPIRGKS